MVDYVRIRFHGLREFVSDPPLEKPLIFLVFFQHDIYRDRLHSRFQDTNNTK